MSHTGVHERGCPMCHSWARTVRRTVDGWELATCDDCSFLFAPIVRDDTATEIEFPDDYVPPSRARHRHIHHLLAGLLDSGDTLVDVGAGFGELGVITCDAGALSYVGYEPSASVARVAQARGVDLRPELFGPTSLVEPAAAVVLDNVIEHVEDPIGLLSTCTSVLRPGGVLVVVVPNRHDVRQLAPRWRDHNHWIPPEHINYFTAKSLRHALADAGLEVHPFGFAALTRTDWKYWPRAAAELAGLFPVGLNMYGISR